MPRLAATAVSPSTTLYRTLDNAHRAMRLDGAPYRGADDTMRVTLIAWLAANAAASLDGSDAEYDLICLALQDAFRRGDHPTPAPAPPSLLSVETVAQPYDWRVCGADLRVVAALLATFFLGALAVQWA